jgi:hypothetical protein
MQVMSRRVRKAKTALINGQHNQRSVIGPLINAVGAGGFQQRGFQGSRGKIDVVANEFEQLILAEFCSGVVTSF